MIYIVYAIFITAFGLFFIGLAPKPADTISVFGQKKKEERGSALSPVLKLFTPFNKLLLRSFKGQKPLDQQINIAKWKLTGPEFFSAKELLAIMLPLMLFLLFGVRHGLWLFAAAVIGFVLPSFVLSSKVKKRKYSIVRVLPETVDLLGLCVGAGLDFMSAVRWVIDKVKINPLIEELATVLKEINVGKPRIEALKDMSKRLNIPDITSFVRTITTPAIKINVKRLNKRILFVIFAISASK